MAQSGVQVLIQTPTIHRNIISTINKPIEYNKSIVFLFDILNPIKTSTNVEIRVDGY